MAPDVFELDDDVYLVVKAEETTPEALGDVQRAVAACPRAAIALEAPTSSRASALAAELGPSAHLAHHDVSDQASWLALVADTEDAEIVRCTVDLAHSLGLLVVAEGVEDDETWERLRDLGCDAVQGWLVAAAMPAEETTAWLRARGSRGWVKPAKPAAALPAVTSDE